jgi:hypothetical protein
MCDGPKQHIAMPVHLLSAPCVAVRDEDGTEATNGVVLYCKKSNGRALPALATRPAMSIPDLVQHGTKAAAKSHLAITMYPVKTALGNFTLATSAIPHAKYFKHHAKGTYHAADALQKRQLNEVEAACRGLLASGPVLVLLDSGADLMGGDTAFVDWAWARGVCHSWRVNYIEGTNMLEEADARGGLIAVVSAGLRLTGFVGNGLAIPEHLGGNARSALCVDVAFWDDAQPTTYKAAKHVVELDRKREEGGGNLLKRPVEDRCGKAPKGRQSLGGASSAPSGAGGACSMAADLVKQLVDTDPKADSLDSSEEEDEGSDGGSPVESGQD